ncbi:MAG TPA: PqiC family protein [Steroidobacteraceae bacterium]|jgi:hypothetical protein|nr:PqiC family protein [Steroidobacteraceae bacterium]
MTRTRLAGTGGAAPLAAALAMLLAGCGHSPPTRFFTLAAVRADAAQRAFAGAPVQVRAVHIPAVLDRPERVVGRSPQQLDIVETQQWGAPLDDMIRRVLSQDLSARLPAGMVLMARAPASLGTRGVVVDIQEFQPDAGGNVVLDASWVVLGAVPAAQGGQQAHGLGRNSTSSPQADQPIARGARRWQLPGGAGADAQVAGMSALLGRLADAIAASVRGAAS